MPTQPLRNRPGTLAAEKCCMAGIQESPTNPSTENRLLTLRARETHQIINHFSHNNSPHESIYANEHVINQCGRYRHY